jgi:Uma2 family endonuclease
MDRQPCDMTTAAAEGLPRRRFTVAELERMTELGILDEDERIELIGGDVVVMSPKGHQHEILKMALTHYWSPKLPADLTFVTETTFVFFPKSSGIPGLTAATAKLVVEIANSSLGYELSRKAALYAGFGIAELWVVDAVKLSTQIHREPKPQGYLSVTALAAGARLVPQALPGLAVTLAELELH